MSDYIASAAEAVKSLVTQRSGASSNGGGGTTSGHVSLGQAAGYQKAELEIEGGAQIKCWFNPTQYSITKQNAWSVKPPAAGKKGPPKAQFGGVQPKELSLDLLFDASDSSKDVRKEVIDKLFEMMEPDPSLASAQSKKSARPPMVTFSWGEVVLKAVAKSLNVQYTLFHPDGKPIRAAVKLSLMEVPEGGLDVGQNPTTRGEVTRAHVVRDGDTLQSIAFTAYRDPSRWRVIAEANDIDDPMSLERGRALAIPRLEG
jgi:nucleoid-associated protein YgaU